MITRFLRCPAAYFLWAGILASLMLPVSSVAHGVGENYIFLNCREDSIDGRFEFHVNDLKEKLDVDLVSNREGASQTLDASAGAIKEYIGDNFQIWAAGGKPYTIEFGAHEILKDPSTFVAFHFRIDTGPLPDKIWIRHTMCYENDRFHRALLVLDYNIKTDIRHGEEYVAMVFSPSNPEQELDLIDVPSLLTPRDMVWQGVLHIWMGIDHILFLLSLMLPVVLFREDGTWKPVPEFSRSFWSLLKIVTAFTVAHSVTLLLAALEYIKVPSRLVESMIALSIILVAANNFKGRVRGGSLMIILVLGLFHGLGFASVMGHLPFRMNVVLKCVIGFNIGVELGQIAIVAILFPILFFLRKSRFYVPGLLWGGSAVLIVVAGIWFVQRALSLG